MEQAKKDIFLGIKSNIVHKFIIDNAADCVGLIELNKTCEQIEQINSYYLFGFLHMLAHSLINTSLIMELTGVLKKFKWRY